MKKLSPEQIVENLTKFYNLIDKYLPKERAERLKAFYKTIEETLSLSPASTRINNHNCFAGGYLDHVIRVTEAALVIEKVWDKFGQNKNYTTEELVFSAINHDLGKLGTNEEPYYLPNDSQWHIEKQGILYKYNFKIPHMRIADRSLFYLQQAGIMVTDNEFIAIKTHDGLYEEANKDYYMPFSPELKMKTSLPFILHQADLMASQIEIQNK